MPLRPIPDEPVILSAKSTRSRKVSLRLTEAEREDLQMRAGRQPMGGYIRTRLFAENDNTPPPRRSGGILREDRKLLATILARLGQSGIADSLRCLDEAARSGSLIMDPETKAALKTALGNIAAIKTLIMKALRVRED